MKSADQKHGFNIVILIFFFSSTLIAQTVKIRVVDDKQIPLEGATVKSLHQVFTTNRDGEFEYRIVPDDSMQIRYLGYKEKLQVINRHFLSEPIIQLEAMPFDLNQVNVVHTNKSTSVISNIDLKVKPVSSSQEILRSVPGLFIGQHAGGGKAEQLFLRGFDIDHGTDVSVNFEGMPVNMTSHAHGQGYADLHFIIPEVVENINFGKGPYYADKGNFTTAAYVDFKVKEIFDRSGITLEAGQYNSLRGAAFFNLINTPKTKSYIASEYNLSDGWFDSPQDFNRFNLMGRVQHDLNKKNKLSLLVSQFSSKWNASGQVPNRAIESGLISRFGSIDNTEGGNTARQNLIIKLDSKLGEGKFFSQNAYISRYNFNLFSNFTFFLNDPLNGDQIKQKERRTVSG
nr:TonB-dependent receptor plug domain-containing protein [Saprospiraceae bacterium]